MKGLNMRGEVLAILEVKLLLAALFGRACGNVTLSRRVAKDRCAKLLVHEDSCFLFRYPVCDRALEPLVNNLLGRRDLRRLLRRKRAFPAEHAGLKRAPMVERKDVQRLLIATNRHTFSLSSR